MRPSRSTYHHYNYATSLWLLLVACYCCCCFTSLCKAWTTVSPIHKTTLICKQRRNSFRNALSDTAYQENDLVAILVQDDGNNNQSRCRLCVVISDGNVSPLCQHEDDVTTDLYLDLRDNHGDQEWWQSVTDEHVRQCYGEGWYGQRPVPSLGGGPGYGAQADEVWSVSQKVLEQIQRDGVELPVVDVGMAHGEKARSGRGALT